MLPLLGNRYTQTQLEWESCGPKKKKQGRKRTCRLELQNTEDPLPVPLVLLED